MHFIRVNLRNRGLNRAFFWLISGLERADFLKRILAYQRLDWQEFKGKFV
jgi:hypothetical protein